MRINCTEDIIEEIDIAVLVDGTSELDTLLLPTAEVDPTLTDLRLVAELHHLEVLLQTAHPDHLLVPRPVHGLPKQDVLFNGAILNPCRLCDICCATTHLHLQPDVKVRSNYVNALFCDKSYIFFSLKMSILL
jgi:hypothetical protein